jgi:hypothetical protein
MVVRPRMQLKSKQIFLSFSAIFVVIWAAGCSSLVSEQSSNQRVRSSFEQPAPLDRIRTGTIVNWQSTAEGLWIELSAPRRTYLFGLRPSCSFELRQATTFEISGASSEFIGVGDEIVVGESRCVITNIAVTEEGASPRSSIEVSERKPFQ